MMADNLKDFDISQNTAGLLGCFATLAGCLAGSCSVHTKSFV